MTRTSVLYLPWFCVKVQNVFLKNIINKNPFSDNYVDTIDDKVKIFYVEALTVTNEI